MLQDFHPYQPLDIFNCERPIRNKNKRQTCNKVVMFSLPKYYNLTEINSLPPSVVC